MVVHSWQLDKMQAKRHTIYDLRKQLVKIERTCWQLPEFEVLHGTRCDQWFLGVVKHKTLRMQEVLDQGHYDLCSLKVWCSHTEIVPFW